MFRRSSSPESQSESQLGQWLKPVRRRMAAVLVVKRAAAGLLSGSCAAVIVLLAARLWPIAGAVRIAAALTAAGLAAGIWAALRTRFDDRAAAREMDRSGADDAIVTALDMLHTDTPAARLQRADAEAAAARYVADLNERLPWPRGRTRTRWLLGLAAAWTCAAVLMLVPNPMDERLAARSALNEQISRIEEALDELEQSAGIELQERQALAEPLKRLRDDAVKMDAESLRAEWEAAEREIARLAAALKEEQQALRKWAQKLQRTPELSGLGQALERGDKQGVAEAAGQLGGELSRLTSEEREALAERLRELAADAPETAAGRLRDQLDQAADALAEGRAEAASDMLEQALAGALSAADLHALAEQTASALAAAESKLAAGAAAKADGTGGWDGMADAGSGRPEGEASSGEGRTGEEGTSPGTGGRGEGNAGTGRSGGEGSAGAGRSGGQGQGGAAAGGDAGEGGATAGGGGAGQGGGSGGGGAGGDAPGSGIGPGAGFGGGGRALVTTPRIYEGEGNVLTDGGPASGGTVSEGGSSPLLDGGVHHYEEVYAAYEADARRAVSSGTLPPALKERVKQYFDEIQPDR